MKIEYKMPNKGGKGKKKSKNMSKNPVAKEIVTLESVTKDIIESGLQVNNTLFYGYIEQIFSGSAIDVVYYPDMKDVTKTAKVRTHVKISFVKQRVASKGANVLIALRDFNKNEADLIQVYNDNASKRIEFFRELNKVKNSNYKGVVFVSDVDTTDMDDPAAIKLMKEKQREQRRAKNNNQSYVNFDELMANPNKKVEEVESEESTDEEKSQESNDEESNENSNSEDDEKESERPDVKRDKKEKTLEKKKRYTHLYQKVEDDFL